MNLNRLSRLLDVPLTDPDDARRRKLLNILLAGIMVLTLLIFLTATIVGLTSQEWEQLTMLYLGSLAMLLGVMIVFVLNRYRAGWLASSLFLLLFVVVIIVVEPPEEVTSGRSTFVLAIPVIMSSVLLWPWASFVTAGMVSLLIVGIEAFVLHVVPGVPTVFVFFAIALVSWLSARSLEQALEDLRTINRELDQRVAQRTRELSQANEQLTAANERLKELDRLKTMFLSTVSHDLRTPLGAILGFAEMLEAGVYGPLSEKQEGAMQRIVDNAGRQMNLVNDLLDQARMEAGQLSLEVTSFAPAELLDGLLADMNALVQAKGLELTSHIASDVPATLSGDPRRLLQILTNLVGNAIKFTEQGGVHVRLYLPDKAHWALEVSDTGPGIPEEAQDYVFDPFRLVDSSITRKHGGIGLGLAIVKRLTNLMGGEVILESEVGRGSTFTVVLPLEPA